MPIRNCAPTENTIQATRARDAGYRESFAPVTATIESVDEDAKQVTFSAKGSSRTFVMPWRFPEIWVDCPTTIASQPDKLPVPEPDEVGVVYVGADVYNHILDNDARRFTHLKWPVEMPIDFAATAAATVMTKALPTDIFYRPIVLRVLSITITAVTAEQENLAFELFGIDCPNNVLNLSGVYTRLSMTHAANSDCHSIRMKIVHAVVEAADLRGDFINTVDLLDPDLADPFQVIDLSDRSRVAIKLSQRGRARFGEGSHPGASQVAGAE